MDDGIGEIEHDDASANTITLNADGFLLMRLNYSQGTDTWSAELACDGVSGRFGFGLLATTKALCLPPSMGERIDLDANGRQEVLILLMGSIFCGTGGCNLHLFSDTEVGDSLINTFPRSRLPLIAVPRKRAG